MLRVHKLGPLEHVQQTRRMSKVFLIYTKWNIYQSVQGIKDMDTRRIRVGLIVNRPCWLPRAV